MRVDLEIEGAAGWVADDKSRPGTPVVGRGFTKSEALVDYLAKIGLIKMVDDAGQVWDVGVGEFSVMVEAQVGEDGVIRDIRPISPDIVAKDPKTR